MTNLLNDGAPFLHADHRGVGMDRRAFRAAVSSGDVVRVFDRVYRDTRVEDTRETRVAAAKLAVPEHAVLSDETAAWIWGVDAHKPSDRHRLSPRWVVPHGGGRSRIEGIDCRQALLDEHDVVEVDSLRVTSPIRTTADLLRKQYRPHALAAADAMAGAGAIRAMDVRDYLTGLKGYRGIRQARVLARYIEPRSASPGESWTRLRVIDAGFPVPEAQLEVIDAAGQRRFLDLAYRRRRVAVEFDGRQFHTADDHALHDDHRRTMIQAMGFTIVTARYEDVFGADPHLENELGQILGITPIARWWT